MCIRDRYHPPKNRALLSSFITPTFRPCAHTSDDSNIYQLSLVLATATVSLMLLLYVRTCALQYITASTTILLAVHTFIQEQQSKYMLWSFSYTFLEQVSGRKLLAFSHYLLWLPSWVDSSLGLHAKDRNSPSRRLKHPSMEPKQTSSINQPTG